MWWEWLKEHYSIIWVYGVGIGGIVVGLLVLLMVLSSEERPSFSIAWILAIVFVPYLGIPGYIVFGGRKLKQVVRDKALRFEERCPECRTAELPHIARVMSAFALPCPSAHNNLEFVSDGVEAYRRIMQLIEGARESIFVEIFILDDDAVGDAIVKKLIEKAEGGVDVRLLADAYGSFRTWRKYRPAIEAAGGRVGVFMRLLPFYRKWSLNLRNHRKALIVDERTAVVGGMNIGEEYMGPEPDSDRWVDTLAIIKGPAVSDVVDQFVSDWEYATNEKIEPQRIGDWKAPHVGSGAMIQVVPSGPDVVGDPLYAAMVAGILNARERIWIVTPYFVPDDGLMKALGVAARMELDVRLVIPEKSNHPVADITRSNFIRRLKGDGVKVYYFSERMIHAKNVVIDDDFTVVGSVNFDVRSLFFNFEIAVFTYSRAEVEVVADWMKTVMAKSELRGIIPVTPVRRLLEQLFFLVSPMI